MKNHLIFSEIHFSVHGKVSLAWENERIFKNYDRESDRYLALDVH